MAEALSRILAAPCRVHLIGIGGIGMAGLARLLMQAGYTVSGSDSQSNRLTRQLTAEGVTVYQGHHPAQVLPYPDWAIRTPALGEGNPELDILRAQHLPVFLRGEVLAAYANRHRCIAVAGAHGKTTTTSMLASLLHTAGQGSGYAVGGETALPGSVANRGEGKTLVLEADESDGTLVYYRPEVGVLTHVEWDHIERFRSEASLLQCYRHFVGNCESVWIREGDVLAEKVCEGKNRVFRVGRSADADVQLLKTADDPSGQTVFFHFREERFECRISLPGIHNAWNALMAVAAATHFGVPVSTASAALGKFQGVARRFQKLNKRGVMLIQDYAHHPTEIRALMESAKALKPKRLWLVFQPHRFSRTRHLLDDFAASFAGADRLALLPVYAASELPGQGVGSDLLAERCRQYHEKVDVFPDRASLMEKWLPEIKTGDVVLIVGAGDIEALQTELGERL